MTWTLSPIDLGDRAALEQAYALETAVTRERRGSSWTPLPVGVRITRWTNQSEWTFSLVGAWDADRLVGLGQRCFWEHEPQDVFVDVLVDAASRRRGIGSALLGALEHESDGARRFLSEPLLASRDQADALTGGFCRRHGYALGTLEILQEMDLSDAPPAPAEVEDGWRVESYVDGLPAALLPEVGVIQGLVDEEAPSGEVAWNAHVVRPEQYLRDLDEVRGEGSHLVEAVVLAPDGRVAGWTGLTTAVSPDRPAQVRATLVLDEFRGHGLGMALKSAVAERAREVGVTRLATESDEQNRWMLGINERQGFRPVGVRAIFQRQIGAETRGEASWTHADPSAAPR